MATVTRMGPLDHGRPMTLDEFLTTGSEEGYHYELIDGKVYVSPLPNMPEDVVEKWLFRKVDRYAEAHPSIINYVTDKARIFVPGRHRVTAPEPDLAAYRNIPLTRLLFPSFRWQDYSPLLVGEILSADDPDKDLVRNVDLYWQVASIREYWVIDARDGAGQPSMRVYRRRGQRWQIIDLVYGDIYTTKLLPGFVLTIDPLS